MDTEERRQLYENYVVEDKKKRTLLILFITATVILIIFVWRPFSQNMSVDKLPIETALLGAVHAGSYLAETNLSEDVCYWVRSTTDNRGYLMEVLKYRSASKNCIGELLNKTEIRMDKPLNLLGKDCICGKKICEVRNFAEGNRTNLEIKGC